MFEGIKKSVKRSRSRDPFRRYRRHMRNNSSPVAVCQNKEMDQKMSIDEMLADPNLKNELIRIAKKGFFLENIEFINEFEKVKTKTGPAHLRGVGKLNDNFIVEGSTNQINIDHPLRNELEESLLDYQQKMSKYICMVMNNGDAPQDIHTALKASAERMNVALESTVVALKDLLKKNVVLNTL